MATAHQLSIVTNSCHKSPVNPHTGLVYNPTEPRGVALVSSWGPDDVVQDESGDFSKMRLSQSVNFDTPSNTMIDTINVDLEDLTDEEFYKRLTDMKLEHKKTLQLCERLYHEKLNESRTGPGFNPQPSISKTSLTEDYALVAPRSRVQAHDELRQSFDSTVGIKTVGKPPSGKPPVGRSKSGSAHVRPVQARHSTEDYWAHSVSSDTDFSGDEALNRSGPHNRSGQLDTSQASAQIREMWENFSVDNYAPASSKPQIRRRSNSLTLSPDSKVEISTEWKNRITIPKPFNMTVREANKTPQKTKAMEEVAQRREELYLQNEAECQKQFKARPVPAHVYMPLFDEVMEEKESKRRYRQQASAEILLQSQKPFKFDVREQNKKNIRRSISSPAYEKPPKTTFKANPFPEHIFDETIDSHLKEEEEYRKIRIQMRSEELLHSASLPSNMKVRGSHYTEGKSRKKLHATRAKKAGFTTEHKFAPRINHDVPDFEKLHHKLSSDVSRKRHEKEATVCKPFKLSARNIAVGRNKIYRDIAQDEEDLRERSYKFNKARLQSASMLSTSLDSIPAKMTTSALLRSSATKSRKDSLMEKEQQQLDQLRRRRQKEKEMKKYISERVVDNDNTCILQNSARQKLKEFKSTQKARDKEYQRHLREIDQRVSKRPLLFEQTMQENARKRAEKKYLATIGRAGVDEDLISSVDYRGADSGEDYDDGISPGYSSHHSDVSPRYSSHHSDVSPRYSSHHSDVSPRYSSHHSDVSPGYSSHYTGTHSAGDAVLTDNSVDELDDDEVDHEVVGS